VQAYYTEEGAPDVGKRLIAEIISKIERLGAHPLSGRVVPEFNVEHLREIIYPPFRIVYRHDKNKVRIVRIRRSERLLKMP
jgi:plasmid stabilization system protein ParE